MSELKYVIFFAVLLVGVPFNYKMAIKYPLYEKFLWFLLIFFTAYMVDINFASMETYKGTSRGFEIGMVDIVVFSMLAVIIGRKDKHPLRLPPGTFLYTLYFLFSFISIINSDILIVSFFELWKMIRMYIFFFVVYNMIRTFEELDYIMLFISYVVIFITLFVLKQKYVDGMFQCAGPFPHQNSLVMYMVIAGSLLLAYLINNEKVKIYYWLPVFGATSIDIISTLSRGGLAIFGFAIIIVFFFSYINRISFRKLGITMLFLLGGSAVLYKASDSIIERFETAPEESTDTRITLAIAAKNMANDKIFGVGLNNFGPKMTSAYPYANHFHDEREADEDDDYKGTLVETVYMSIAAETGWHNLIVYLTLLFGMYFRNYRNFLKMKNHPYRFIPIGLMGGLLAIYIQSTLEWVLKQTNNFYQLMFVFAIIGIIARLLEKEKDNENFK